MKSKLYRAKWLGFCAAFLISLLTVTACSSGGGGGGKDDGGVTPPVVTDPTVTVATPAALTVAACDDAPLTGLSREINKIVPLKVARKASALRIHYQRTAGDYSGWGLHFWNLDGSAANTTGIDWATPLVAAGTDAFGPYYDVPLSAETGTIGYIFHKADEKDHGGADQSYVLNGKFEIWRKQGDPTTYETDPATISVPDAEFVRVHYKRFAQDFAGFGLHIWEMTSGKDIDSARLPSGVVIGEWSNPVPFASPMTTGNDAFGVWIDVPVKKYSEGARGFNFLVHKGSDDAGKDGGDRAMTFLQGYEIWLLEGDNSVHYTMPKGDVSPDSAKAYFANRDTILWPHVDGSGEFRLYYSGNADIAVNEGVSGAENSLLLTKFDASTLPSALQEKFKYVLKPYVALKLPTLNDATRKKLLQTQLMLVRSDSSGVLDATQLQLPGAIDDLYATAANAKTYGVTVQNDKPDFQLWAPTAFAAAVCVYDAGNSGSAVSVHAMTRDDASGSWHYQGDAAQLGKYYRYLVDVYVRSENANVRNLVTDPYSVSLSADSQRSWIGVLSNAAVKPDGWDTHTVPALDAPEDLAIYEAHVRDFSAKDQTVPSAHRGKYLAFTDDASDGMQHLMNLQSAGLTMLHLLPVNDIGTIPERDCVNPVIPASAPDSEDQQAAVYAVRDNDCFNWGYDPLHYTAIEGSYATDPSDATVRVKEFRAAIKNLHSKGLRVALDVVYNHTPSSGQDKRSVLDKVVPGYYHRLDSVGNVTNSTCCSNTATEHAMMAKLMIDSVSTLAHEYQIDAFRFDIMGHQPLSVMNELQTAVNASAGRPIYLYGEGWNFGEVANDARFVQATQKNLAGSGIGSFNDRIRDAVRGGGAFDGGNALIQNQGLVNGIFLDDNGSGGGKMLSDLFWVSDIVRLGMAATLKDYSMQVSDGSTKLGNAVDYYGIGAGYTLDPQEVINYVDKHDNQTLFDINGYKLPLTTSMSDRVRVQSLGIASVALAQGVPFFHAGMDILRSKSYDRDSYNSGDHFNAIDWSLTSNNYGVGAPIAEKNQDNYGVIKPRLADTNMKPTLSAAQQTSIAFREWLAIRKSSTLFRLRTGEDVKNRLHLHNTGSTQIPGVIAYSIEGNDYTGAVYNKVAVFINVDKAPHTITVPTLSSGNFALHPVHVGGNDAVVKTASYNNDSGAFTIPARTAAVFVSP